MYDTFVEALGFPQISLPRQIMGWVGLELGISAFAKLVLIHWNSFHLSLHEAGLFA